MVTCQICQKQMKWIQNTHLRQHGITLDEYRLKYPGSPTKTQEMHDELVRTRKRSHRVPIKLCIAEGCDSPVKNWRNNKYCSSRCNATHNVKVGLHHKGYTTHLNPNYTNGEYSHGKRQKQLAYERDNGCCVKCGMSIDGKSIKYGVHHLIPRRLIEDKELADSLDNLVSLCSKDHKIIEAEFVEHLYSLYTQQKNLDTNELILYLRNKI